MAAGDKAFWSDISSRFRVGTGYEDTDSSTFTTTTTVIVSCVAQLVAGRTYRVKLVTHIGLASPTTADSASLGIREDSVSGTELQGLNSLPLPSSTAAGHYGQLETDYTAVATGSKTFVGTAVRNAGTGTLRREAAGIRPTILSVDYAYGD